MKGLVMSAACSAAMRLGCASIADAADLDIAMTKAPAGTKTPPTTCTSIPDFFLTGCQLSWYGVRFYGTIDVGYQTHRAPFDPNFVTGASYFLQKMNRSPMWGLAPNGLGQSNVDIQIKEPLGPSWSFAFGAQLGGDFLAGLGTLSLDVIGNYNKDAVNLTLSGAPTNAAGVPIGTMLPQTVTATPSDNTNVMAFAKYTVEKVKLCAGYEWMQFAPPSDPFTVAGTGFTTIVGDFVCFDCAIATAATNINSTAYSASAGFKNSKQQKLLRGHDGRSVRYDRL